MKKVIKSILQKLNFVLLTTQGYRNILINNYTPFHSLLNYISVLYTNKKHIRILQIGANDLVTNDSLSKIIGSISYEGIFVEPQLIPFTAIKAKESENLHAENVAIAENAGEETLYQFEDLAENGINLTVFASFYEDHLTKYKNKLNIKSNIAARKVKTCRVKTLLDKYNWQYDFDLLIMDCEGYDPVIIRQIFKDNICPKIIQFEHRNLSENERKDLYVEISAKGYYIETEGGDTICIKVNDPVFANNLKQNH